jgi:hypothetical protein
MMVPCTLVANTHYCHVSKNNLPIVALFKVCKHSLLPILEHENQTKYICNGTNFDYNKLGQCSFQKTKVPKTYLLTLQFRS